MPPLGSAYRLSGGLFLESDLLSLAPGLSVKDGCLADAAVTAKHRLHPLAAAGLLRLGQGETPAGEWVSYLGSLGMGPAEAREIFSFLQLIGGIGLRRGWRGKAAMLGRSFGMLAAAGTFPSPASRSAAGLRGIASAALAAIVPLLLSVPLALAALYAAGFALRPAAWEACCALAALYLGVTAHEYSHAAALRASHPELACLRRGMKLAILHPPLPAKREAASAVLGPLAGIAASCLVPALLVPLTGASAALLTGVSLSLLHLASLLPFYGDGRALIRLILPHPDAS